jgi:hypothetical protein
LDNICQKYRAPLAGSPTVNVTKQPGHEAGRKFSGLAIKHLKTDTSLGFSP